jgi:hypothetical protein
MKYVKLIAKPDTWFKEGTEVWSYDKPCRLTLQEWEDCVNFTGIKGVCVRGIRVVEFDSEIAMGYKVGEEIVDGEFCGCDEFIVEVIEEDKIFNEHI